MASFKDFFQLCSRRVLKQVICISITPFAWQFMAQFSTTGIAYKVGSSEHIIQKIFSLGMGFVKKRKALNSEATYFFDLQCRKVAASAGRAVVSCHILDLPYIKLLDAELDCNKFCHYCQNVLLTAVFTWCLLQGGRKESNISGGHMGKKIQVIHLEGKPMKNYSFPLLPATQSVSYAS